MNHAELNDLLNEMLDEEADTLLKEIAAERSSCPSPARFFFAYPAEWTAAEREHIETCPHCEKSLVTMRSLDGAKKWVESPPSPVTIARHAAAKMSEEEIAAFEAYLSLGVPGVETARTLLEDSIYIKALAAALAGKDILVEVGNSLQAMTAELAFSFEALLMAAETRLEERTDVDEEICHVVGCSVYQGPEQRSTGNSADLNKTISMENEGLTVKISLVGEISLRIEVATRGEDVGRNVLVEILSGVIEPIRAQLKLDDKGSAIQVIPVAGARTILGDCSVLAACVPKAPGN